MMGNFLWLQQFLRQYESAVERDEGSQEGFAVV
jgi:hypothetical protein